MSKEAIDSVDTSTIEELQKLKERVDVLQGRLEAMEERQEAVTEAVFERVQADYRSQLDELAEEASPLKAKARAEYARLRETYLQLQSAQSEARLAKEEIEFRHELGEFEGKEFEGLRKEHSATLAECEQDLAAAEAVRQRFIEAFGSEEELESETEATEEVALVSDESPKEEDEEHEDPVGTMALPAGGKASEEQDADAAEPSSSAENGEEAVDEVVEEGSSESDGSSDAEGASEVDEREESTSVTEAASTDGAQNGSDGPGEDSEDDQAEIEGDDEGDGDWSTASTNVFSTPLVPSDTPPPPPFNPVSSQGPPPMVSDATRILPKPRLVALEGGEPSSTYVLGPTVVTMGRATDNSIRLTEEAVSRHHAEVIPGPDGFMLRDMGSENGTYVNGKRKKEHLLIEGDLVQIGVRKLRFHES
ncbi:MAG: FHA domain-containing protein [Thermoanaerobaculia bacterium]|nr:FHA domain-containing protein [Thermoanaerobaculia bacterium]